MENDNYNREQGHEWIGNRTDIVVCSWWVAECIAMELFAFEHQDKLWMDALHIISVAALVFGKGIIRWLGTIGLTVYSLIMLFLAAVMSLIMIIESEAAEQVPHIFIITNTVAILDFIISVAYIIILIKRRRKRKFLH